MKFLARPVNKFKDRPQKRPQESHVKASYHTPAGLKLGNPVRIDYSDALMQKLG